MKEGCTHGAAYGAALEAARAMMEATRAPYARYQVECIGADGVPRWRDQFTNMVVTSGKNDLLTQYFKGSGYSASWFVGLIDSAGFTAIATADTMGTHAGWNESTAYASASRPALVLGAASAGAIDNSGSVAAFSINATATLKGAFVVTSNVKGGVAGTLYSAGTFAADRVVGPGDTLNVTITLMAS